MKKMELARVVEIHGRGWRLVKHPDTVEPVTFRVEIFRECDDPSLFIARVWLYETFDLVPTFSEFEDVVSSEDIMKDVSNLWFSDRTLSSTMRQFHLEIKL